MLFEKIKGLSHGDLSNEILSMLKHMISGNKCLRVAAYKEETTASKPYEFPSTGEKEFELKEVCKNIHVINPIEENIKSLNQENSSQNNEFLPIIVTHQEETTEKQVNEEKATLILPGEFEFEVLNFIWTLVTSNYKTLANEALKCLTEVLSRNFCERKMEFVQRCVENISGNNNIHESLQVMLFI